jgi:hypothetical protein
VPVLPRRRHEIGQPVQEVKIWVSATTSILPEKQHMEKLLRAGADGAGNHAVAAYGSAFTNSIQSVSS